MPTKKRHKLKRGDVVMVKDCVWSEFHGVVHETGIVDSAESLVVLEKNLARIEFDNGRILAFRPCELIRLRDATNVEE